MTELFFLGVDGGGTKTEFLCIDGDGQERARARTGTTYHLQVGFDGAVAALSAGVGDICAQMSITPADFAYAFIGLPAFGEDPAVDPQLDAACGRLLGHDRYSCANDMVCGWAGSLACEDGINLVAGTGSIAYGRRKDREGRTGGWGELFSDEGSAYWIAIRGLNAFTRMSDGRAAKGPLYEIIRVALGISNDLDLCAKLLGKDGPGRDGIAALAPLVAEAAEAGDSAAAAILTEAAEELLSLATALRRELGFADDERCALSWSGGVLLRQPAVQRQFRELVEREGLFDAVEPRWSPVFGAAQLARRLHAAL
ncbi:N-acetylglucosamine kinase [Altererythrobacter sp. B11]|uniref:N-acetylglucosamine kinase n=1 Tax=Altererythrobacter sp. B11 TaxID=2060312 RepID=UPI000DC6ED3A|nr:BadF/BadG/BcrA/BcrD ATPase family protein [Altererythrobacter sp. B11]BBC73411.1 N-acetylglucosamine kinase [Altererythrobacter sp. B11]